MLGYFPDPYPDELLYSLCARFSDAMQYPLNSTTAQELFGESRIGTLATFPTHIDRLVRLLPPLAGYTAEQFINEHTLFPYYAAFLPEEYQSRLRKTMKEGTGTAPHRLLGKRIALPPWLRFCPGCVEEERKTFGECYWHRLHQLFGVEVCPTHRLFLQNSAVRPFHALYRTQITSAQAAIHGYAKPEALDAANPSHQIFLQIAQDTAWLLGQHLLTLNSEECHNRYLTLLREQDLATYSGIIKMEALAQRFQEFYPPALLTRFFSPLDASVKNHWLARLLRHSVPGQPPLRHLLVLHFLRSSPTSFFHLSAKKTLFGDGPWPCLNPTCEQYRQATILKCQITYTRTKEGQRPMGLFACTCGFVYCRRGPDQVEDDRFRIGAVRTYGPRWQAQLQEGWSDNTLSLQQLANQLGVGQTTIINYATRIGLPFPRRGVCYPSKQTQALLQRQSKEGHFVAKQEACRKVFVTVRVEHPEWGRQELGKELANTYSWLMRHDRRWLDEHLPTRLSKKGRSHQTSPEVNKSRDEWLAQEVRTAAQRLRSAKPVLVRVSRLAIGAEIHQVALFKNKDRLAQFPLTISVLAEVLETPEAFAVRRIWWTAECYHRKGLLLTRKCLIQDARVKGSSTIWNQVRDAIEDVLSLDGLA